MPGSVMHGKTSAVHHKDAGVFRGLKEPLVATRYHSLVIERESLPEALEITAWTDDGEIMVCATRARRWRACSFIRVDPERAGHELLRNFLARRH